jgi:hypothetical protein
VLAYKPVYFATVVIYDRKLFILSATDVNILIDCLRFVMCLILAQSSLLFVFFLLQPLTVLMKRTRQPVRTIKHSIYLDVYGTKGLSLAG